MSSTQTATPELRQWILEQAQAGHSPDAVLQAMVQSGWDEEVALDGDVAATVRESEYLGADCLLRCRIGDQEIAVRAPGQNRFDAGQEVRLGWPVSAVHAFDAQGLRLP